MHAAARKTALLSRAEIRRIVAATVIGNGFVAYEFTVFSAVVTGKKQQNLREQAATMRTGPAHLPDA